MDDQVKDIFAHIDLIRVSGQYASSMIEGCCPDFVKFLFNTLDADTIDKCCKDPNDVKILDMVGNLGFDFYNHVYIGNKGYEWVETYI